MKSKPSDHDFDALAMIKHWPSAAMTSEVADAIEFAARGNMTTYGDLATDTSRCVDLGAFLPTRSPLKEC